MTKYIISLIFIVLLVFGTAIVEAQIFDSATQVRLVLVDL